MMNTPKKIVYDFLIGSGFDVHALQSLDHDNLIMLAGVAIPCRYKLIAHSVCDVILHALVDAILGAIGEGDIGEHFSPADSRWKNADSAQFIHHALALCAQKNAQLVNVDITIIGEHPTISPHKPIMKNNLEKLLFLKSERINIKATTTEKLGFLGRSEGIAAQAVVSVKIPVLFESI